MKKHLIQFENIPWDTTTPGIEQKVVQKENNKLRLIIFKDDFIEKHWCTKGHVGYVLEGEMKIDFDRMICDYKAGDGLWIESGENHKHKVMIEKGKFVKLVLFEK